MRVLGWVLGGMLVAAVLHLALMSPVERGRILQVTKSPASVAEERASPTEASPADRADAGGRVADRAAQPPGAAVGGDVPSPDVGGTPITAPSGLAMPVQGVQPGDLSPTFEDARAGGRVHEALDIMAPAGTPVLAVADGHVEKLFDSRQGGLTIYQFEPTGRYAYYYAHLERYAPGLAEGQAVRRGQVLGYVGSSGNADPSAPHLHFAIFALGPERRWWEGTPIDPYPLLAAPR